MQCRFVDVLLFDGADVACGDPVDGFGHQRRAPVHQFVVERTHVVFGQDRHANLSDDGAFVDLVVQQEGRDARFRLPVDDCPVDGRRTAVLRQQRGVEVERPQARHGPDYLGQHPECDDDPQVGPQCLHRRDEFRGLEFLGLQYRQPQFECGQFHVAPVEFLPAAGGFVGCGHHAHDVIAPGDQRPERRHGEFGRAHEYDTQFFRVHRCLTFFRPASRRRARPVSSHGFIACPAPACGAYAAPWSSGSAGCAHWGR